MSHDLEVLIERSERSAKEMERLSVIAQQLVEASKKALEGARAYVAIPPSNADEHWKRE